MAAAAWCCHLGREVAECPKVWDLQQDLFGFGLW